MGTRDTQKDGGASCGDEEVPGVGHASGLEAARQHSRLLDWTQYNERRPLDAVTELPPSMRNSPPSKLAARGMSETSCGVDYQTGELKCYHLAAPRNLDCRQWYCSHRQTMVVRVVTRLRAKALAHVNGLRKGRQS